MKRTVIALAMSLCVVSLAAVVSADTLVLRDGRRVEGTVVGLAARTITFRRADGTSQRYRTSEVAALEFASPAQVDRRGPRSSRLEVPAGTELVVRTTEAIDSRNAPPDRTFRAVVERDVRSRSGRVIIPGNSRARLIVRRLSSGGATGSPELVLDVQSITVNGRRYLVSTADLSHGSGTGIGRNKRTAEAVGGGGVLGSIIGAIAGGGKGAAIGGLVGAAGGAGVQVLTRGHDVRVPADTVLRFRLDRAVTLESAR
ncbi:MAG TPA: hypothetical protein VNE16_11770 [Vicinamibacterales bacterium]|nr:hypothetical protein [Thermomicrobiaceae bacterium]HVC20749.1 hypothetical protein [Vicinamibacterales bacterium]